MRIIYYVLNMGQVAVMYMGSSQQSVLHVPMFLCTEMVYLCTY